MAADLDVWLYSVHVAEVSERRTGKFTPGLGTVGDRTTCFSSGTRPANSGRATDNGWPSAPEVTGNGDPHFLVSLPGDDGVLFGNLTSLNDAVDQVDAVVSLCRVGTEQVPAALEHHQVWLVDQDGEGANPNLRFVLGDTVDAILALRSEGKRVFVHCVAGASRTPAVAAAYLARREEISTTEALERVAAAVPFHNRHNSCLLEALEQG